LENPTNPEWLNYSIEFCGGTHISNTSDGKLFKVILERSTAKGIRRIEAFTNELAKKSTVIGEDFLKKLSTVKTSEPKELLKELNVLRTSFSTLVVPLLLSESIKSRLEELSSVLKSEKKDLKKDAFSHVEKLCSEAKEKKN